MIWQVICQVGADDDFIPVLHSQEARLLIVLDQPSSPYQVGNRVLSLLGENGLEPGETVIDLLNLAMCVYSADMRIQRRFAGDKWAREIVVHFPVVKINLWKKALDFGNQKWPTSAP